MATANYKIYKTSPNGNTTYQILSGTNTPYGFTEVTDPTEVENFYNKPAGFYAGDTLRYATNNQADAMKYASQNAMSGYFSPGDSSQWNNFLNQQMGNTTQGAIYNSIKAGQQVSSGLSQDAQGNWGEWDKIAADTAAHDKAVAAGLEQKVPLGNGQYGYIKTPAGAAQLNTELLSSGKGGDPNQPGSPTYNATPTSTPTSNSSSTTLYLKTTGQAQAVNNENLSAYLSSGNWSTSPSSSTPTSTPTTVSSANLQAGSTDKEANINLQNFLKSKGYDIGPTGADGIIGPKTTAAIKAYQLANGLTPDGIVGTNTASKMNNVLPTAPVTNSIQMNVPSTVSSPVLPTQTADKTQEAYMTSLNTQIQNMQIQIDNQRIQQLDKLQQDKIQAQQDLADLRNQQSEIINEQGATAIAEKEQKQIEIQKEIQRFDEAYQVKQGLTNQLQDLISQGNALILSQKASTGLTAIRNPRVNETISNLSAAAAVLKIGIDAQDNNMTNVQNQLSTAVSAITSSYKDQLDYYTTLSTFYESMATDKSNQLTNLTSEQQDFINTTINTLQNKIDTVQKNADAMQNLFLDPSTATAFAKAGITLTTPQSEWGTKLAKQAYADELSTLSKDMASKGYTALIGGNAPTGSEVVRVTDSNGVIKTYWKKGDSTSSSQIVPTSLLQSAINSGMSPEEAALDVASYYESIGIPVDQKVINSWIQNARTLTNTTKTPEIVSTTNKTSTPVTAETLGKSTAPIVSNALNYNNSPVGAIGPKQVIDIASGIGDFFKGLATGI